MAGPEACRIAGLEVAGSGARLGLSRRVREEMREEDLPLGVRVMCVSVYFALLSCRIGGSVLQDRRIGPAG